MRIHADPDPKHCFKYIPVLLLTGMIFVENYAEIFLGATFFLPLSFAFSFQSLLLKNPFLRI
jgi:hypothetical protein